MDEKKKGIGLFGLVGIVVSACIGSGIFALTGQLAQVAAPGSALLAWLIVGIGFLMLALSLSNLGARRPDLHGIFSYADEGFGKLPGFISGWGYWLSAWLGNVAFATILMSTLGFFLPYFLPGNNFGSLLLASVIMWLLTLLVIRGVESAAFLNAIVMVCKVVPIVVFILFAIVLFQGGVFTADFWGQLSSNASSAASEGADLGSVSNQVVNCFIIMMWVFIGIEGAAVVSARARKKSDAGKATIIGLIVLLCIYVGASVLPFGYMPYSEIALLEKPAMLYVFDMMAPGWGGIFISIAMIISVLGSWLSFTILPSETTSMMSEQKLLPKIFNKLNEKGSPQISLIIVGICTQVFLISLFFSQDAYNFAMSMCTVTIAVTWALAAAYQVKYSSQNRQWPQMIIGLIAVIFQVVGVVFTGWSFLLLACIGYIPGFVLYYFARKEAGASGFSSAEKVGVGVISALGVVAIILLIAGVISF